MKLDQEQTQLLSNLLSVASICGIGSIVIVDGKARGINESKTCALISTDNLPQFSTKIGIGRIRDLQSRITVFAGKTDVVVDVKESDRGEVSALEISSGRNKVQYRCTSVVMLNDSIPKNVPDAFTPAVKIFMQKDEMRTLLDAVRVMGSKKITLVVKTDRTVSFTVADAGNDNFTVTLNTPAEIINADETIVQYYSADVLGPVMKEKMDGDTAVFNLGERGTFSTSVHGHTVIALPQIGDDGDE